MHNHLAIRPDFLCNLTMQLCESALNMFGKGAAPAPPIFSCRAQAVRIWRMPDHIEEDILLRKLYPELSDAERIEVKEFLDAYCALILRICEREEREQKGSFDEPLRGR